MSIEINNNISNLDNLISKFFEYFQCAVCMNDLRSTYVTKECAHRFCENCIKECIDALHKCPLCNRHLNSHEDIVKDVQYDDLMLCVNELKAKNEDKLFKTLSSNPEQSENSVDPELTPLEIILKKHLLKILNVHQTYYKQLEKHFLNELKLINDKLNDELAKQHNTTLDSIQATKINQILIERFEVEKQNLKNDFDKSAQLICQAYDKYLNENTPKPAVFPVTVKIKLHTKKINVDGLILKPDDDIKCLFSFIEQHVEKTNDKIVEYDANLKIFCFGPFSRLDFKQLDEIYRQYENTASLPADVQIIPIKDCKPILEYSIKPGSHFILFGAIKFESDLPSKCFTKLFDPHTLKSVDYYVCTTCNLKWICKNCKFECHRDHDTTLFILGHKPTWACCYCKRKECHLLDN